MPSGIYIRTEKIKQAMSKAQIGKKLSEETRKKMSEAFKGRKYSEEAKKKMSIAKQNMTKETKKKISESLIGHKVTKEIRLKMSLVQIGKKHSESSKRKMSEAKQNITDETKKKISKTLKGKYTGKNNHMWRGGTCKEPYCSEFTKDLKEFIKDRDNYKCMNPMCDNKNDLCVHHINYDKKYCILKNLITLCRSCNFKANFNRGDWKEMYRTIIKQNYVY